MTFYILKESLFITTWDNKEPLSIKAHGVPKYFAVFQFGTRVE